MRRAFFVTFVVLIGLGFSQISLPLTVHAQEGQSCDTGVASSCPTLYTCRAISAADRYAGRCTCAWGKLEVGIFQSEKGTSICELLDTIGTDRGISGTAKIIQSAITGVSALTIMAAMVSIVVGGYIYMTAGGNADRVRVAKYWIGSALLGIVLAVLSFLILNTINTNLV